MGIVSFKVNNEKAVLHAECPSVPRVMVIAGPNGVGKSTLLYAIKRPGVAKYTGRFLYISPRRIWRRQQVHLNTLWDQGKSYSEVLGLDTLQAFGGIRIFESARQPNSAEESQSAVKHILSQIEARKQTAINSLFESKGYVAADEIGDVYAALRDLTSYLLPHLTFSKIDIAQRSDVKCLWRRTDASRRVEVDIDDLSSGEQAVISLALPFVEKLINRHLAKLQPGPEPRPETPETDMIVLIDEPELHLHPLLQTRFLEYLRSVASTDGTQFIIATHSVSILNAASHEELFVLTPPSAAGKNQLVRPASSEDRLAALRALCGDTHVLTTCRKIICVEGEVTSHGSVRSTDIDLYKQLYPPVKQAVLLACGGKGNVLATAEKLRENLDGLATVVDVLALLDADQGPHAAGRPWAAYLPVCMVENLLLSPRHLFEYLRALPGGDQFVDEGAVSNALNDIAGSLKNEEVKRRVITRFKAITLQPEGNSLDEIHEYVQRQVKGNLPTEEEYQRWQRDAEDVVGKIMDEGKALERFHGKTIIKIFYDKFVKPRVPYHTFLIQMADKIGKDPEAHDDFRKIVADLLEMPKPNITGVRAT